MWPGYESSPVPVCGLRLLLLLALFRVFFSGFSVFPSSTKTIVVQPFEQLGPVIHLRPCPHYAGGISKRSFTLKTHQMFSFHTTPGGIKKKKKNRNNHRSFWICVFGKTWSGKSRDHRDAIVFDDLCFQTVVCPREDENSSGLENLLFRN